jgi:hypothetical protein
MDAQQLLSLFESELKNAKKPFLFHDCDCDGTYSYLQLKKANKNLRASSISKSRDVQIRVFEENVMEENDVIFFFDTPQIEEDLIKELQTQMPNRKIFIVDHHENRLQELVEKYNLIYFNPLNFDKKDSRPSCFWANKVTNMEENLVSMVIGSVSDFFLLDVVNELEKQDRKTFDFLFNIPKEKQDEILEFIKKYEFNDDSVQEKRANLIQMIFYETNLGKIRALVDFLYKLKSESHKDAISIIEKTPLHELVISIDAGQGFLFEDFYLFQKKQKKLVEKALEKNKGKEFVIFEHKGKTSYNRQLSEELLYRIPETKVMWLIFKKMESDWTSCSFRARFPYVINTAISDSLEGLKGQGGGHPQSGGCAVNLKDFDTFKERFEKKINDQLNNN